MDIILKYTLKKIQEQTSIIPYINRGGCCHFAKLLAKELEQRNIAYKVALIDWNSEQCVRTVNFVKKKALESQGVSHVCIKIGKYLVDSELISSNLEKIMDSDDYECKCYKLNYKQLVFLSNGHFWNSSFNRRKYHPEISKIIKEQFKMYDRLCKNNL